MACPDDNVLVAMAEHALEPAEFAAVEVHIDTCEACRKVVAAAVSERSLAAGTLPGDDLEPIQSLIDTSINDRYVIEALLGRGGMGTVYLARDRTLDRKVALKLHRAGSGGERLHREAMAMAKLAHPNVVTVFEVATVDDRLYVAMEYVRGETLRGWLQSGKRTWRQVVAMLLDAGNGLAAAHAAGLVHRDFKPENVLVGDDGRPRVGDFGLARVGAAIETARPGFTPGRPAVRSRPSPLDTPMTQVGTLLGTPAYMAPEQLAGEIVDVRCDQFAFCVVAWECLFGLRPFGGNTLVTLQLAIEQREFQRPPKTDVPQRVRLVLERGLSAEPKARYRNMPALLAALRAAAAPRTKRHVAIGVAGVVVLAGAGVAIAALVGQRRHEAACAEAGNDMLRAFDDLKRAEIRAAFVATGSPFAAVAYERSAEVFGRYSNILATQAIAVCRGFDEPARVTAARRACLADRRRELIEFADVLSKPDRAMVQRAGGAAWAMFDPTPCDDPPTLLARAATPNATTREQAAQLRRVKALGDAGRYEEGTSLARPLLAAARATGDKSLELGAVSALAQIQAEIEGPDVASLFHQAVTLSETLGRDLDAASAYAALANHAGVVLHDYGEAHRYVGLARAKLERIGGRNPAVRGDLAMIEAQVLLDENRLGEAEAAMRQGVATIEEAYGGDHPKLGRALGTFSQVLRAQHKIEESLAVSQRTLSVLENALGADHPTVAGSRMNLAQDLMATHKLGEAREHLMRADIVFARVFGDVHPLRAAIAGNLGGLEYLQGNWDAALVASRRAISILEQVQGADSADVSGARRDVAKTLARAGRLDDAVAEQTRALAILDKLGPDAEGRLVSGLTELADYELARAKPTAAIPHAEKALAIAARRPADANPKEVADAKFALARALFDSKRDRARARKLAAEIRDAIQQADRRAELEHILGGE